MIENAKSWTEADLRALINTETEENIGLEYKAAAALSKQDAAKKEISKDVSAFANSAGGVIVYGMQEAIHRPVKIDPIDAQQFSKEWIENVITSNIQPRIDGLHINVVRVKEDGREGVAYVLTIPQSFTAHQAADHRYYKRFNFKSEPMQHFEVQDTMNRARTPLVDVELTTALVDITPELHKYAIYPVLTNRGARAARALKFVLVVPAVLNPSSPVAPRVLSRVGAAGTSYDAFRFQLELELPLFPEDSLHTKERNFVVGFRVDANSHKAIQRIDPVVEWTIFADDMVPRRGSDRVLDIIKF